MEAPWNGPVCCSSRADGRKVVYPHTLTDRGKPGSLVVNRAGRRFTNEAVSYHRYGEALLQGNAETRNLPAWIVCDTTFIWKYGLGAIIPFTRNLKPYQRAGYLETADSLPEGRALTSLRPGSKLSRLGETLAAVLKHAA